MEKDSLLIRQSKRRSGNLKWVSACLVFTFFFQDLAWAGIDPESVRTLAASFQNPQTDLPAEIGFVEERFDAPAAGKRFFLIQDAHTNANAQEQIALALESLFRKNALRYVFLEAGTGDDSLTRLRAEAGLEDRRAAGEKYLEQGYLQGADYFDLTSDREVRLWGVEDKALYFKGLELYRELKKKRDHANGCLDRIRNTVKLLKPRVYGPALAGVDARREAYLAGDLPVTGYLEALFQAASQAGLPLGAFPELEKFRSIRRTEAEIDFGKSMVEWPELVKYFAYLKEARKLSAGRALKEAEELEKLVYLTLCRTADERRLVEAARAEEVLRRLMNLRLSSIDFYRMRLSPEAFDVVRLEGFLNAKILGLQSHYEHALLLDGEFERLIGLAKEFYELTQGRDRAFLKHALAKMDAEKERAAVLVAGGYHTDHLKAILRENNISYVSILPNLSHETNFEKYERILLGQPFDAPSGLAQGSARLWAPLPAAEQTVIVDGVRLSVVDALRREWQGARLAKKDDQPEKLVIRSGILPDSWYQRWGRMNAQKLLKLGDRFFHKFQGVEFDHVLDWALGITPLEIQSLASYWPLKREAEEGGEQVIYEPTSYGILIELFKKLWLTKRDVFYDLGSGNGRVVIFTTLATHVGKAVGIEIVRHRHRLALKAARALRLRNAKFRNQNILDATFEDGTVFFLFNLFSESTLRSVLAALEVIGTERKIRIVFFGLSKNPLSGLRWLKKTGNIPLYPEGEVSIFESYARNPRRVLEPVGIVPGDFITYGVLLTAALLTMASSSCGVRRSKAARPRA